ncbi:MAG: hypothetical protein JXB30_14770 [Anaerolineae bacterium]|nr:hypothetical protein [Anaerolineae bacterium]
MNAKPVNWLILLMLLSLFTSSCGTLTEIPETPIPTGGNAQENPEASNTIDDLGCFPVGCDLPPGMKELCQAYEAGEINWPASCSEMPGQACQSLCEREKALAEQSGTSPVTTFIVHIPENTMVSLGVFLELFDESGERLGALPMEQVDSYTWLVEVPAGKSVRYRYMRDGLGFTTAEQFTPDSETAMREGEMAPGAVIEDVVDQWRWFPAPDEEMPVVETAAADWPVADRVGDIPFMCGYEFVDFWWEPFHDLVAPTNQAMLQGHANWVRLAPAMDYEQVNPLPVISDSREVFGHTYPTEMLDFHIEKSQQDGLNVLLTPQICCSNPDASLSFSDAWWQAWFAEMNDYATYYSQVAARHGITHMAIPDSPLWQNPGAPKDVADRYAEYIAIVRSNFSGQLGVWWDTDSRFGSTALYNFSFTPEEFDFIALGFNLALAESTDPSVDEVYNNARQAIDNTLAPLYAQYDMPIIIASTGYTSVDGDLMRVIDDIEDPAIQHYFEYSDKFDLDLAEQATAYEGLMRAVAETPYIIGFFPFNAYWPTPFRADKNLTVWGKPAGEVLSGWYARLGEKSE